jgi:transcription elongation factor Elf1
MVRDPKSAADIKETDIVFDCPHCGKSLAIDYRGAGLTIKCSDCGRDVQVPIPEGMEIEDIDSSNEDQEIRILHLRKSLATAQDRIKNLESDVEQLISRRENLEKNRTDGMYRMGQVLEKMGVIADALKLADQAVKDVTKNCSPEEDA